MDAQTYEYESPLSKGEFLRLESVKLAVSMCVAGKIGDHKVFSLARDIYDHVKKNQ